MPKQSQAAMEFLLTYGWAITIGIVAISALAYFGVLDPRDLFFHPVCEAPTGFSCLDHRMEYTPPDGGLGQSGSNTLTLYLKNNQGYKYSKDTFVGFQCDLIGYPNNWCVISELLETENGEVFENTGGEHLVITFQQPADPSGSPLEAYFTSGQKYDFKIILRLKNVASGLPHPITFHITGKVDN